jgi:murein DD-endopeptidase MepM/ murein hydrolase activator NlpD
VQKTDFPRRDIVLPKDYVDFTPEEVAKINSENDKMIAVMSRYNDTKLWEGEFIRPVPGKLISPFGQLRFIDGEPKSPHTALDLQAAVGDPVHPTNSGLVVMAETFFLPGNTLIIDHGHGIFSMYFHLNKIKVQVGDTVLKSTIIGEVGKTGRATGPHLHFGMRMNKAKVDPLKLIGLKFYQENSNELDQFK